MTRLAQFLASRFFFPLYNKENWNRGIGLDNLESASDFDEYTVTGVEAAHRYLQGQPCTYLGTDAQFDHTCDWSTSHKLSEAGEAVFPYHPFLFVLLKGGGGLASSSNKSNLLFDIEAQGAWLWPGRIRSFRPGGVFQSQKRAKGRILTNVEILDSLDRLEKFSVSLPLCCRHDSTHPLCIV